MEQADTVGTRRARNSSQGDWRLGDMQNAEIMTALFVVDVQLLIYPTAYHAFSYFIKLDNQAYLKQDC